MVYNRLRLDFKRELILHVMKSIKETFLLALEIELSTFKIRKRCSMCEIWTPCVWVPPRSSVLSVENLDIMITSAPRRVNKLIMCKLMTDNSRIVEDVHISSEITSDVVDDLTKSSTPT